MLQVDNQTPFKAEIAVLPDRQGVDTLFVMVKATINLRPKLSLAPAQTPPSLIDEYYEDPETSSLKEPSELHLGKPGTDVLLFGCARAPGGEPVEGVMVSMSVAERRRQLLVMGDRVWLDDGTPSAAQPFTAIPLVWERAFGGVNREDPDHIRAEERNPVGVGFRGKRAVEQMVGLPVPNLEHPTATLNNWDEVPDPVCFAPISPSWLPRRMFAGTYDEKWLKSRAPYLPSDFDPRFFQCAPGEMCFDRHLQGGDAVQIHGATEDGPVNFIIPDVVPIIEVKLAGKPEEPQARLETLAFYPDENRASMTWRAALPCDRKVLKVENVIIRLRRSRSAG